MNGSFAPYTGRFLVNVLLNAGWSCDRGSGDHTVMTKPGCRSISIREQAPSRDTVAIIERQLGYKLNTPKLFEKTKAQTLPHILSYNGTNFAVAEQQGDYWMLQSLNTGTKFKVLKARCKPPVEEGTPTQMPELNVVPADEAPPQQFEVTRSETYPQPTPLEPVRPMSNPSSREALVRMTRQHYEALKVRREQILNELAGIDKQFQAASGFLVSLGYTEDAALFQIPAVETPKAKVPTPGTSKKRRKPNAPKITPEMKDKIRMAWIDTGQGMPKAVEQAMLRSGVRPMPTTKTIGNTIRGFKSLDK